MSYNQLSSVVPGVLTVYDLPELAATLAPRPLTLRAPVTAALQPVTQAQLDDAHAAVRELRRNLRQAGGSDPIRLAH
jgi:hypothetical protein